MFTGLFGVVVDQGHPPNNDICPVPQIPNARCVAAQNLKRVAPRITHLARLEGSLHC